MIVRYAKPPLQALLCVLIILLTITNAFAQAADTDKLVFLGNRNIAPVVYLENATPSGVAVDIVSALAKHMPRQIEVRAMDWTEAQALVASGEADALIQINETEARKKIYDFSDTLLESQFSIFTTTNRIGISGISSLRGLRVGVESGGLPRLLMEKNPNIMLITIPNFLEGFKLLHEGAIDAVVVDYRVGAYVLAANRLRDIKVSGEPIAFSYSSFAVKKGNSKLLDEINSALRIIKADGTYQKIIDKWEPKEVVFQTREQIERNTFYAAAAILLILLLIAAGWTLTLRGELAKRKAAEEALRRLNRELRAISNCNQIMMRAQDEQTLLSDICRVICDEAGYRMAWVGYAEHDDDKSIRPVAWAGAETGYLQDARLTWADTERGRGPSGMTIRSGQSACIQDFSADPLAEPWREGALRRGYRSSIALPIKDERTITFGLLNIYSSEPNVFTPDETRLLCELADDLAFGITVLRDITDRKRAEEDLRRYKGQLEETVQRRTAELMLARNAAEAANKAKSAFLANISHELRTPLNAILGFSRMMRRNLRLSDSQSSEHLDIINRSGEHLLTLINDVLEVAKIEAGRLQLAIAPFDLGYMVREVTDVMRLRAEEKGLYLRLDQSSEFPRYIRGDEARLRQILINLVSNAVKFTEQGGVVIRLSAKENAVRHLLIEVEDTGPGIRPEERERVFKPFVQLAEGGEQIGTGLGLTITRQFVELMGGGIVVESTLGKGSLFRVELPVQLADSADIAALQHREQGEVVGLAPGQRSHRVLIAEDRHENQLLLDRLMTGIGLETKLAENGAKCVRLFQEWHPDLVWMDRTMPVMDGLEATRRIRQLPDGDKVKIVAVTASALEEEQQEMLDAGMDDVVAKPYRFGEIYACLARQLGLKYTYQSDSPEDEAPAVVLTPALLATLPAPLRHELRGALETLDSERIAGLLQQVAEVNPELGSALFRLARNFDYPAILNALDEVSDRL